MTTPQFEESLCSGTGNEMERNWVRSRVAEAMGDRHFWLGDIEGARMHYRNGLKANPRRQLTRVKLFLLNLGTPGRHIRALLSFRGA